MSNFGADQTLELVKDGAKFKKKLEELAKVEASANAAMEKSRELNKQVFAEVDTAKAELENIRKQRKAVMDEGMRPLEAKQNELSKLELQMTKDRNRLDNALAKLKADQAAIKAEKADLKERVIVFEARVAAFEKSVKSVCERA